MAGRGGAGGNGQNNAALAETDRGARLLGAVGWTQSEAQSKASAADAILKENYIPVEMMRAGLMNLPLTRDYKSNWKFAGAAQ